VELALELADVLVELVPEAARGPPRKAAFHWAGVAQPVTPAFFSASAAIAIAMYVSPYPSVPVGLNVAVLPSPLSVTDFPLWSDSTIFLAFSSLQATSANCDVIC